MSLLVTGSLGIDTVITPQEKAVDVLGGSAVYFAFAASYFTHVRLVGVVGEDFPPAMRDVLASRDIDLRGLEVRKGSKTFRWTGEYAENMNERETLDVELNVLEEAAPTMPDAYADSEVIFLANTHPTLQQTMRESIHGPRLAVCDTMDLWIKTARDELLETLKVVDGVIINDSEAQLLTGKTQTIHAGDDLMKMGPQFAVIKKGEHGAILMTRTGVCSIPSYPTRNVCDPTGAGDAFAGGMIGYLATQSEINDNALRRGLLRGTVTASFTIEDFSLRRLQQIEREQIDQRVDEFRRMLRIE